MTKQEIFNKVWQYFVVEKHPRSVEGDLCYYRHPSGDGRRCAAGLFISDAEYRKSLEGAPTNASNVRAALANSGFSDDELSRALLRDLQRAHDCSALEFVDEGLLRSVGHVHILDVPA